MMKKMLILSTVFAVAALPAAASAQSPETRIDAAMSAAAKANIPVSLLQSKVDEGEAKNVPQERVAAAVEARLQALIRASETMKRADVEAYSATDLAVTADAIEAGVNQNALIKISRSAPPERRAVAVATLSGLVQLGHASEQALARVSAVINSNAALANLQADVASQLQLGQGNAGSNANVNAAGIIRIK
jgi:hypothetical protein